jgi:hypothetical protein
MEAAMGSKVRAGPTAAPAVVFGVFGAEAAGVAVGLEPAACEGVGLGAALGLAAAALTVTAACISHHDLGRPAHPDSDSMVASASVIMTTSYIPLSAWAGAGGPAARLIGRNRLDQPFP